MSPLSRLTAVMLLPLAMTAGVAATTGTGTQAQAAGDGPHCEITVSKRGGMTTLEGIVTSPQSLSGSYRMSVVTSGSGGGSDIDQSGAFSATAGKSASLGVVSLGGAASYSAELTVKWSGGSTRCVKQIGGKT